MRKRRIAVLVAVALTLVITACGDETDSVEDAARRTADTVADAADRTADTAADAAKRAADEARSRAEGATRLTATLTGAAEVPHQGDPDGTGTASVNIDVSKGELCYEVAVQKIDRPVGMHIHEGEAGKSGRVVVALTTPSGSDTTTKGCVSPDGALLGRITANPGGFYVNVHTETYPDGALRGQLTQ